MNHSALAFSHKFSGASDGVPCSVQLSSVTKAPSGPGTDGQYHHSGLYQLSGWLTLLSVVHARVQTDPLELQSVSLSQSVTHSGDFECRGGPALQGAPRCTKSGHFTRRWSNRFGLAMEVPWWICWRPGRTLGARDFILCTIKIARASSTRSSYDYKWRVF